MNVNFELYKIFCKVAETGNISKAAAALSISQPAISKSIKNLEEQLGGILFTRTKKGVILTNEGNTFYHHIQLAMTHIKNAENSFQSALELEVGMIKIGISQTLLRNFLLPFLDSFRNQYPKIEIQILTEMEEELIKKLKYGLLDIIFTNTPVTLDHELKFTECRKLQDCFVVGKKYQYLTEKTWDLKELTHLPFIFPLGNSTSGKFLNSFLDKHHISLTPYMLLSGHSLIQDFTKLEFGIGYVTKEYTKELLKHKELYELKTIPKIPTREVGFVTLKNMAYNFATSKLITIIVNKKKTNS